MPRTTDVPLTGTQRYLQSLEKDEAFNVGVIAGIRLINRQGRDIYEKLKLRFFCIDKEGRASVVTRTVADRLSEAEKDILKVAGVKLVDKRPTEIGAGTEFLFEDIDSPTPEYTEPKALQALAR